MSDLDEQRAKIPENMTPLSLASFQNIADELIRRFPCVAVVVKRYEGNEKFPRLQSSQWGGDHDTLIGMLETIKRHVMDSKIDGTEERGVDEI